MDYLSIYKMNDGISVHGIEEFVAPGEMSNLSPFIDTEHYLRLAICLLFVGLSIMAWFFM